MSNPTESFQAALLSLDRLAARDCVAQAADRLSAMEIVDQIVVSALKYIGDGWERGDIALSQVYMSGRICEELVDALLPADAASRKDLPAMAIGVLEDHHLLGKRIVYSVLRAAGFALKDYGRVTVDEVVEKVRIDRIELLLLSTLMLHSALAVRDVVSRLKAQGLQVKVIVGGAPFLFDSRLWIEVGADAMGVSAADVPGIIEQLSGDAP
jgi:methanogenic corrinoid protein MtbC1